MLSPQQLSSLALRTCRERAEQALGHEVHVQVVASQTEWHRILLRSVFEQHMVVWKPCHPFEVIAQDDGRVVGFVDHDKYKPPGEADLSHDEIVALVLDEELIPAGAQVTGVQTLRGPRGGRLYRARVALRQPAREYAELEVDINPVRPAVVAVRPVEKAHG